MSQYANEDRVKAILDTESEIDAETFAALNETASAELDDACGVLGFGTDPEPSTLYFGATTGPALVLDPPALSVDAVTTTAPNSTPPTTGSSGNPATPSTGSSASTAAASPVRSP